MRGAADRSSLCHPGFHRQDVVPSIPAVRPSCRATLEASTNCSPATMSEVTAEIGDRNPFIMPSKVPHEDFETVVLVAAVAFVAVILALTCWLGTMEGY